jgi:nucleoside permease NupC
MAIHASFAQPHGLEILVFVLAIQAVINVVNWINGALSAEVIQRLHFSWIFGAVIALAGRIQLEYVRSVIALRFDASSRFVNEFSLASPHRFRDVQRVHLHPMTMQHHGGDQVMSAFAGALVKEILIPAAIPPEAARDQEQQTGAEEKAAFALEAGLAEHTFE